VESYFDDYDIELGKPNPKTGVWVLMCYCTTCDSSWKEVFQVKVESLGREER
jgi:hypothetical protein